MTVTVNIHTDHNTHHIVIGPAALSKVRYQFNPTGDQTIDKAKLSAAAFIQMAYSMLEAAPVSYEAVNELNDAVSLMQSAQMKLVCAIARIKDAS